MQFTLEHLKDFGLERQIQFIEGRIEKVEDTNILAHLPALQSFLDLCMTSPYFDISGKANGLYMQRDWLIPKSPDKPAARIHKLHRSDLDRAAHNHPWNNVSVLLSGSYYELVPAFNGVEDLSIVPDALRSQCNNVEPLIAIHRKAGDVICRTPAMRHKLLVLQEDLPSSLFLTAKKSDEWGFTTERGWVHHTLYVDDLMQENPA